MQFCCRAPCGARGLKQDLDGFEDLKPESRPVRGAWIETRYQRPRPTVNLVAPRAGRVD